ncbi:MerR family transcriptional regulator [Antrihabitans cavernicola]|uniref:MerR family transcriptional regulator n=1 Tax=Antrihabitans cavernicola TaxID=2495913 RepID=A0A5A7SDD5_9NOCA|nr:MerR family transcriptional regulator [Spelaeibacter cavernicola]KAA0024168.1 MerR family transcriptional regulator [Spelaeibacter cavernicola]
MGIGQLAAAADLPVRTIRFYCDHGILESQRSSGGHRVFDADIAIGHVVLIRRLRALGLGLPVIADVLHDQRSLGEAVAVQCAELDVELATLAWRRASLRAIESAPPKQRAARLALLAAAQDGHAAHEELVRFWRSILGAMGPKHFDGYLAMSVPEPPASPDPTDVLAYAELTDIVTRPRSKAAVWEQIWKTQLGQIRDQRGFLTDLARVCLNVLPLVTQGVQPHPGSELDAFVAAHATARKQHDSPHFRGRLLQEARYADPNTSRYWALTAELLGTPATVGHAHHWLCQALNYSVHLKR